MLLTVSTTHEPARDLGYLLHKHPDRVQEFRQSFGTATVLFPEATDERTTVALLLDVDPVRLARSRPRNAPDFSLAQYVNDRPYAASSLLAVALGDVFSTARAGRGGSRQDLADTALPLVIEVPVLPCRGGSEVAHRLFAPLGWSVEADPLPLDERFPAWGDSRYVRLRLTGTVRLADALNQLYVLLPVLDESKHYWQPADEVDKLLRSGGDWLATHPERELVTRRYLARTGLARAALVRLAEVGGDVADETDERPVPLNTRRRDAVLQVLSELGATSVIDLGCGQGQLVEALLGDPSYTRVAGMEVSSGALRQAARRLRTDEMGERQAERLTLFQGALTYEDPRLAGYDAAVLMEVVEHVDPPRLAALEHVVFATARPGAVVLTTPNADYNPRYEHLVGMRHPDHRFEWTRAELADWAGGVAERNGYDVELRGIGDPDPELGAPTQLAVFRRA
ncbi:3' terminal RNA ribose 2'-O-methyltransferase Hen1 [Nocardioides lianchengensis]|uniref:Small RNA 2'-O-methyltransferase n=1 Tax=Nocardioides lianchengensis TaxID=1045774 RepID=A0A1G6RLP7_9ACTN|nr:3' terminal RNA ribose 2'-O-methyltransferase Hen1 [Nocardioides lianchengensis]NYG10189.1 3' terminal RNA ribose 2'-O-methyltransferase Hen1 [Nocardioides lianchengensis]SDD05572.1 3' terminal RNA ribose 2'-O-methyltransferase Hen1 [Nocardioides lianchengensis]